MYTHTNILYALIALLTAGQLYMFFGAGIMKQEDAAIIQTATPVVPAVLTSASVTVHIGLVILVDDGLLTVESQDSTLRVALSEGTRIVEETGIKSDQVHRKELEEFNAEVARLMQDWEKNKRTLEELLPPTVFVERAINPADLREGERVAVISIGTNADGSLRAAKIVRPYRGTER